MVPVSKCHRASSKCSIFNALSAIISPLLSTHRPHLWHLIPTICQDQGSHLGSVKIRLAEPREYVRWIYGGGGSWAIVAAACWGVKISAGRGNGQHGHTGQWSPPGTLSLMGPGFGSLGNQNISDVNRCNCAPQVVTIIISVGTIDEHSALFPDDQFLFVFTACWMLTCSIWWHSVCWFQQNYKVKVRKASYS